MKNKIKKKKKEEEKFGIKNFGLKFRIKRKNKNEKIEKEK
jgi:hypothetical protein